MKKIINIVIFLLLNIIVFSAPSYNIDNLKIDAIINEDGTMDIKEEITYDISQINGIYYNIDVRDVGDIYNLDVGFSENGKIVRAIHKNSQSKGYYTTNFEDDILKIKLYCPTYSEKRTFYINYSLSAPLTVYNDVAQLNRKMVGENWDKGIKNIEILVHLPKNVKNEDTYAFGHMRSISSNIQGNVEILDEKTIKYSVKNNIPHNFVELDMIFPREVVNKIPISLVKNYDGKEKILLMEQKILENEEDWEQKEKIKGTLKKIIFIFQGIAYFGVCIGIYIKNYRPYKLNKNQYYRELPENISPAISEIIINKKTYLQKKGVFVTILDLVRRGYFDIREEKNDIILSESKRNIKNLDKLLDYEKIIYDWLIENKNQNQDIELKNIKFRNYGIFRDLIRRKSLEAGIRYEKPSKIIYFFVIVLMIFTMFSVGYFINYFEDSRFLIFLPFVFFLPALAGNSKKYTKVAQERYLECCGMKEFILDYTLLKEEELSSIEKWEYYFVYAVALDIPEKVLKKYKEFMNDKILSSQKNRITVHSNLSSINSINMYRIMNNFENSYNRNLKNSMKVNRGSFPSDFGKGGGFGRGSSGGSGGRSGGGAF